MYEFYKEPRRLNIKKVVIIAVILIVLLMSLTLFIAHKITTPKKKEDSNPATSSTIYDSIDHSISLELPNTFNLNSYNSNLGYLIELHSKEDLSIFVAKEEKIENKTLAEIIEADKLAFLSNFEGHSNLSDTKELSVQNHLSYTYSFHYLDQNSNQPFYLQVIWLEIEDSLYIFDIEFPLDDLPFNTNIASSVLSSFKVN